MEEKIEKLKIEVEALVEEAEYDFQKGEHYRPKVA